MTIPKILAALALMLLLTACHGPAKYTGPALFIGDNTTTNWHVEWIIPGAEKASIPNGKIDQIYKNGLARIEAMRPGLVHIMAGTNEQLLTNKFKVARRVLSLAFAARKAGAIVVIGTIPPASDGATNNTLFDNSRFNNILHIAVRLCGFRLADYNTALATYAGAPRAELFSDGVNPNDAGYEVMKKVLLEALNPTK